MDEEITLNQGLDLPPYQPANYSGRFYGPTTLRTGIEKSHNVTTVRMADQIGVDKVAEVIKRFGINDDPEKIYSLVLGSSETSVLRLARAYAMMANGGKLIKPSMIEKIQDRDGKTIYKRDQRQCNNCIIEIPNSEIAYEDDLNSDNQNKDNSSENDLNEDIFTKKDFSEITIPVLDEIKEEVTDSATAYQITSMLQGVIERGTGWKAKSVGKILGGKTGTTNNAFDSWFVGFSPDLVAAVYIGFDSPSSLGKYETGSSVALPIFVDFMKEALKETPSTPFRVPPTIKFVKINKETGKRASPETPSENTFFEAFKLDDEVEGSNYRDNDFNEDSNFSTDSEEPSGIY
jgi:penicillin-binding protein 1A